MSCVCDSFAFERPHLRGPPEDHRHLRGPGQQGLPGCSHLNSGWLWPGNRSRCVPTEDCVHFKEGHFKCGPQPYCLLWQSHLNIFCTLRSCCGGGGLVRRLGMTGPYLPLMHARPEEKVWINFRVNSANKFKCLFCFKSPKCDASNATTLAVTLKYLATRNL